MSEPRCAAGCGQPAHGGVICRDCTASLQRHLNAVAWLDEQLGMTLSRQDRITNHAGAVGDDGDPLPFKLAALQAASTLHHTLKPWAATFDERCAASSSVALARVLGERIEQIRAHPDAGQLADELAYAVRVARRAVDQPPRLFYAAPCDSCGTDLYAPADDTGRPVVAVLRCRQCGAEYDTHRRRDWLLTHVHDRIATATEIAAALPAVYGAPISVNTIRGWIARGRLVPRGWLHNGAVHTTRQHDRDRPMCRIGDVLDLCDQARQRDAAS